MNAVMGPAPINTASNVNGALIFKYLWIGYMYLIRRSILLTSFCIFQEHHRAFIWSRLKSENADVRIHPAINTLFSLALTNFFLHLWKS